MSSPPASLACVVFPSESKTLPPPTSSFSLLCPLHPLFLPLYPPPFPRRFYLTLTFVSDAVARSSASSFSSIPPGVMVMTLCATCSR